MELIQYKHALISYFKEIYQGDVNKKINRLFTRWIFATPRNEDTLWPTKSIVSEYDLQYCAESPLRPGFTKEVSEILHDCHIIYKTLTSIQELSLPVNLFIHNNNSANTNNVNTSISILPYKKFFSKTQLIRMDKFADECKVSSSKREELYTKMSIFYQGTGGISNHYACPPNVIHSLLPVVELFGTPFNTTSMFFCSPLKCEHQYLRSMGTAQEFLDSKEFTSNTTLLINPPFDTSIINDICKKLLHTLKTAENCIAYVIIPAWDTHFQTEHNLRNSNEVLEGHALLKNAKEFLKGEVLLDREHYFFYNYWNNKYVKVGHTVLLLLSNDKSTSIDYSKCIFDFCNIWKSSCLSQTAFTNTISHKRPRD